MLTVNTLSVTRTFSGEVVDINIQVSSSDEIIFQIQMYDNKTKIVYKGERLSSLDELNSLLERDGYGSVTRDNVTFLTADYVRDHNAFFEFFGI